MGCAIILNKLSTHTREHSREDPTYSKSFLKLNFVKKNHIKTYKLGVIEEVSPSQESSLLI